jgi:hypothetical protein
MRSNTAVAAALTAFSAPPSPQHPSEQQQRRQQPVGSERSSSLAPKADTPSQLLNPLMAFNNHITRFGIPLKLRHTVKGFRNTVVYHIGDTNVAEAEANDKHTAKLQAALLAMLQLHIPYDFAAFMAQPDALSNVSEATKAELLSFWHRARRTAAATGIRGPELGAGWKGKVDVGELLQRMPLNVRHVPCKLKGRGQQQVVRGKGDMAGQQRSSGVQAHPEARLQQQQQQEKEAEEAPGPKPVRHGCPLSILGGIAKERGQKLECKVGQAVGLPGSITATYCIGQQLVGSGTHPNKLAAKIKAGLHALMELLPGYDYERFVVGNGKGHVQDPHGLLAYWLAECKPMVEVQAAGEARRGTRGGVARRGTRGGVARDGSSADSAGAASQQQAVPDGEPGQQIGLVSAHREALITTAHHADSTQPTAAAGSAGLQSSGSMPSQASPAARARAASKWDALPPASTEGADYAAAAARAAAAVGTSAAAGSRARSRKWDTPTPRTPREAHLDVHSQQQEVQQQQQQHPLPPWRQLDSSPAASSAPGAAPASHPHSTAHAAGSAYPGTHPTQLVSVMHKYWDMDSPAVLGQSCSPGSNSTGGAASQPAVHRSPGRQVQPAAGPLGYQHEVYQQRQASRAYLAQLAAALGSDEEEEGAGQGLQQGAGGAADGAAAATAAAAAAAAAEEQEEEEEVEEGELSG